MRAIPATRYLRAQILSEIALSVDHNDMQLGVELMVPLGETALSFSLTTLFVAPRTGGRKMHVIPQQLVRQCRIRGKRR
jgi:hypothetical protein